MQKKHQKCSFLGSTRAQNCSKTKEFEKKFIFFEKYIPLISLLLFLESGKTTTFLRKRLRKVLTTPHKGAIVSPLC